jgi:hypothetical protein
MALQPIHRRYGHGAARLPIGVPPESMRLSECAHSRSDHERLFALLPGLLCAGLAILLAFAASFNRSDDTPPLAELEPTTIEIDSWEPAPHIADVQPPEDVPPQVIEAMPESPIAASDPVADAVEPSTQPSRDFDVALLAMAPTQSMPISATRDTSAIVEKTRPGQRRPDTAAKSDPFPVDTLTQALSAATPLASPSSRLGDRVSAAATSQAERPGSASDSSAPSDVRSWTREARRSDFLAALGEGEPSALASGPPQSSPAARPHVAAAAAIAAGRDVRERVRQQALRDGWHEIPLDELPACSPPERQDQLKKRILLATAARRARECSHPDGQYRFVETRNLNAFLMWSRTNPESASAQPPARDVCDVLMRALVCLEEGSNKDLGVK